MKKLLLFFLLLGINNFLIADVFICNSQDGKQFYTDKPSGKCKKTYILNGNDASYSSKEIRNKSILSNNSLLSYNKNNKLIILEKELINEYQALDYALRLLSKAKYNKRKIILENEVFTRKANIRLLKIEIAKVK